MRESKAMQRKGEMEPTLNNFLLFSRFFLELKVLSQDVSEIVKELTYGGLISLEF